MAKKNSRTRAVVPGTFADNMAELMPRLVEETDQRARKEIAERLAKIYCDSLKDGIDKGLAEAGANPVPVKELRALRRTAAFRLDAAADVVKILISDVGGDGAIEGAMYAVSYLLEDVQDAVEKMEEHLPEPTEEEAANG